MQRRTLPLWVERASLRIFMPLLCFREEGRFHL